MCIRDSSYTECNKNMGIINQRYAAEMPDDWKDEVRCARVKQQPFEVTECKSETFQAWGEALEKLCTKKFADTTRPIKQLRVKSDNTQIIEHKYSYTGTYSSTVIVKRGKKSRCHPATCQHL